MNAPPDLGLPERVTAKIAIAVDGCWHWTGALNQWGYGYFQHNGKRHLAHRAAYEATYGPIPEGRQIDHTCHDPRTCPPGTACPHRRCVNPAHMEAVTPRENTLRGGSMAAEHARRTHCPSGHEYTPENTYLWRGRQRYCRICQAAHRRTLRAKNKALGIVQKRGNA